jgi:ketosteroid isomerase-like protein
MSQANVELIMRGIERFNAGDRNFLAAQLHPDAEIHSRFGTAFGQDPYRGEQGVRDWMDELDRSFESFRITHDEVRDLGDRVLALGQVEIRARGSGIEMTQPMGWVYEVEGGKLTRLLFFSTHAEALAAAGIER